MPPTAVENLRSKRSELIAKSEAIVQKADAEKRELTDDEAGEVERLTAEAKATGDEVAKAQRRADARAAVLAQAEEASRIDPSRTNGAGDLPPALPNGSNGPASLKDPRRGFSSLADFAMAVKGAGPEGAHSSSDPRLRALAAVTGMNQGVAAEGGALVPPAFSKVIYDRLAQQSTSLLSLVDAYPSDPGSDSLDFPAVDETSRANGSRWGGVRGYWLAEGDQLTKSKPKLRRVKVEAHQLAVLAYVTDKLLRNAPALSKFLEKAAVEEIEFLVNDAIIRGTGVGQPKGLLNSGSLVSIAKETNQAAATVVHENVSKMWGRLHPKARANAVWLANVDVEPSFDEMVKTVKNVAGTENVGGFANGLWNPEKQLLKNRRVIWLEQCDTLGTKGDLILWDPSSYLALTQGGIESAMSMHLRFDYAETAFRFMFSVDGQPWIASAITPYKGTKTLTTHVSLDDRA